MIHAADGMMPSDMSTGDDDEIEEERRLLYVALTRARYATWIGWGLCRDVLKTPRPIPRRADQAPVVPALGLEPRPRVLAHPAPGQRPDLTVLAPCLTGT